MSATPPAASPALAAPPVPRAAPAPDARRSLWGVLALSLLLGLVLSAAGVALKERVVRALPAAHEAVAPPSGIRTFLDDAIDSWKPMKLALRIHESPAGDRLWETLREFQVSGATGAAGDLSDFTETKKFQYPLTSLLPIAALEDAGLGSIRSLNTINLAAFGIAAAAVALLAVLRLPAGGRAGALVVGVTALAFALAFYPDFYALRNGNIQLWINALFALACLAWLGGSTAAAGALIALAAMIKPQLGALLLWAVLWRNWSFCAGFLCVAVPAALAAVAVFGLHNNLAYLEVMSTMSRLGERLYANESINGIAHRLADGGVEGVLTRDADYYAPYYRSVHLATLAGGSLLTALALLPAWLRRGTPATLADFALASICFTIASPIVWPFHYGTLLPVYVIALAVLLDRPRDGWSVPLLWMLGASWVLAASYMPFLRLLYERPWNLAGNPHFFAALLLIAVLVQGAGLLRRGAAPARGRPDLVGGSVLAGS
ncbi:glycosyltransferase 87 family protein [Methylobacterium radiodurans]|uniref:DUF2029 domain-containing protein n=1 Tax=Methylobacterium radiodurans TaxID=2202828 RepID=A0A2U8VN58_9HYPH|nr:glycosyltransferase 87 family protein [Methylobacterium radiodurans]AWN34832.1 hypothetical protein DK427_02990 [Methylobacterium radiodurans]